MMMMQLDHVFAMELVVVGEVQIGEVKNAVVAVVVVVVVVAAVDEDAGDDAADVVVLYHWDHQKFCCYYSIYPQIKTNRGNRMGQTKQMNWRLE